MASWASEGQRFWETASSPSQISCTVARTFGVWWTPRPTVTSAFGSSDPAVRMPRGRWYLNDRATRRTSLARSAEASVSPRSPR
jgi:hypothetical protein